MFQSRFGFLIPRIATALLFVFLYSCSSNSHFNSIEKNTQSLTLKASEYQMILSAVGPDSIEVEVVTDGMESFPSFAKASEHKWPLNIVQTEQAIIVTQGQITATVSLNDGSLQFHRDDALLTEQMPYAGKVNFAFKLHSDEQLMGGGQRVLGMDRRGHKLPLYNRADYGYTTESIQMNYSLPAVMSSQQYYLLFDNTAKGELDLDAENKNILSFNAVGGRSAYIIGADTNYPDLIEEYVEVTGKPVMLPRWALGHFISRFGYHTQQEVTEVVNLTQAKDLPADAVILDLYWFGQSIFNHMGNLDWDKNDFPDPQAMISDFTENNIKTILITEPFILSSSNKWQEAVEAGAIATNEDGEPYRYDFYFGNTGLVDIFSDKGRDWFADQYFGLSEQQVAGHWGDLGEPEVHPDDIQHFLETTGKYVRGDVLHNAYGHEWAKLVYDVETAYQPNNRPFILMRSGFAGTQRFGIVPWTGDVSRSWGGLKPQVELTLQMSLFGLGYTHSDIGGFAGTEGFEPEMYLRWSQYGIFQPIYRPHAQEQVASEVVFQDPEIIDIVRDFVKLRYQLTPYNYTLMHEHTQTGMPLMRPMLFENDEWLAVKDQYLWGDAFLVKPVTDPGVAESSVLLPEGYWFNFWNNDVYEGDATVKVPVTLNDIPVMVRAGAFIPMVPELNNLTTYTTNQLIVHYYHHDSITQAEGQMYDDDGLSADAFAAGNYELITFSAENQPEQLQINLAKEGDGFDTANQTRQIKLVIHGLTQPPKQILNGTLQVDNYSFEQAIGQLIIELDESALMKQITLIK